MAVNWTALGVVIGGVNLGLIVITLLLTRRVRASEVEGMIRGRMEDAGINYHGVNLQVYRTIVVENDRSVLEQLRGLLSKYPPGGVEVRMAVSGDIDHSTPINDTAFQSLLAEKGVRGAYDIEGSHAPHQGDEVHITLFAETTRPNEVVSLIRGILEIVADGKRAES